WSAAAAATRWRSVKPTSSPACRRPDNRHLEQLVVAWTCSQGDGNLAVDMAFGLQYYGASDLLDREPGGDALADLAGWERLRDPHQGIGLDLAATGRADTPLEPVRPVVPGPMLATIAKLPLHHATARLALCHAERPVKASFKAAHGPPARK